MNKLTLAEYFRLRTPATHTILAGCALLASVGAPAQDAQSSRSLLEEVIVTAQKRAENVQDVPIAHGNGRGRRRRGVACDRRLCGRCVWTARAIVAHVRIADHREHTCARSYGNGAATTNGRFTRRSCGPFRKGREMQTAEHAENAKPECRIFIFDLLRSLRSLRLLHAQEDKICVNLQVPSSGAT